MTEAYEDMKNKYDASLEIRAQDSKVISALQEQVRTLKQLLGRTHADKEDLTLTKRRYDEETSRPQTNLECSYLAEQIINLRTDLDKAHTDILKFKRTDLNKSLG
jgi:DNA repair exonuclease SbcCD ATPase subunit